MPVRKLLFAAMMLLLAFSWPAQSQNYSSHLSPRVTSLQNRRIMDAAEDEEGYIWMGTDKGLYRYNGSVYKTYFAQGEGFLTSDFILTLCTDSDKRIWVGTDAGIQLIRNGKVERTTSPRLNYVYHLINYSDSTLLYSGPDALYLYNKASGKDQAVIRKDGLVNVTSFWQAGDYLWVKPNNPGNTVLIFDRNFQEVKTVTSSSAITDICYWHGNVYMGTQTGLRLFSPEGIPSPLPASCKDFEKQKIRICHYDTYEERVLIGIADRGIFSLQNGESQPQHILAEELLPSNEPVYKLLSTKETILLFPWWAQEPRTYYRNSREKSALLQGLGIGEIIIGMHPEAQGGWVDVVTPDGVYRFNAFSGVSEKVSLKTLPGSLSIQTSYKGRKGDLYLLDGAGHLTHLQETADGLVQQGQQLSPGLPLLFLWEDYEGHLCGISGKTIYVIGADGSVRTSPLENPVSGIPHQGMDGRIYFVGAEGVFRLESGHRFTRLPIELNRPSCCHLDRNGNLWIGTPGDGLYLYRVADGKMEHFGVKEGLPDNTIRSITSDSSGDLWIGTRNNVVRMSEQSRRISVFDYSVGLSITYSARCALSLQDEWRGERILLGGNQFISIVDPFLTETVRAIPLSLDAFFINGELQEIPDGPLTLSHSQNQFLFYYSGMDFSRNNQINYDYRLEGYDKEWVTAGQNMSASYSQIPPGKYTFRVRVYAPDGELSPTEIMLPIRIKPAPWWSLPAKLGYLALAAILIFLLVRQALAVRRARRAAREAALDKLLAEKEVENKMEAFSSLAHAYLPPLSLVYGPARDLERATGLQEKDRKLVSMIVENAGEMMQLTDQMISFSSMDEAREKMHLETEDLSRMALENETFRNLRSNSESNLSQKDREFVGRLQQTVEENLSDESFNATLLAEKLGMSYTKFYYKVKEVLETTPQDYLISYRLNRAMQLLEAHELNVSEVCYKVGFSSLAGFSRSFKNRFGVPPSSI